MKKIKYFDDNKIKYKTLSKKHKWVINIEYHYNEFFCKAGDIMKTRVYIGSTGTVIIKGKELSLISFKNGELIKHVK